MNHLRIYKNIIGFTTGACQAKIKNIITFLKLSLLSDKLSLLLNKLSPMTGNHSLLSDKLSLLSWKLSLLSCKLSLLISKSDLVPDKLSLLADKLRLLSGKPGLLPEKYEGSREFKYLATYLKLTENYKEVFPVQKEFANNSSIISITNLKTEQL